MFIASYNPKSIGDVLVVVLRPDTIQQKSEKKGNVVRIFDAESNTTLGYNFFGISTVLADLQGHGEEKLNQEQVDKLNKLLEENDFDPELILDANPKFVVGYVESMKEHPDSDHLHITKVKVDNDQELQIVCGAPNIDEGQKVVVAKVGAMMPNGAVIFPGKLRGVESMGMICSARELELPNAPQKRGILVLPETDAFEVGKEFNFVKGAELFTNKA